MLRNSWKAVDQELYPTVLDIFVDPVSEDFYVDLMGYMNFRTVRTMGGDPVSPPP